MAKMKSDAGANGRASATYQSMLKEVESIVEEIASPELDLDSMVEKVERGYELIQRMQKKLEDTKGKIDDLTKKFEQPHS